MSVTDDELQQKRDRNAEASQRLEELNEERTQRERGILNSSKAQKLDEEFDRIQAAIAQAEALNAQAQQQADVITGAAVTTPATERVAEKTPASTPAREVPPPKPDNSAQATGATAEGK